MVYTLMKTDKKIVTNTFHTMVCHNIWAEHNYFASKVSVLGDMMPQITFSPNGMPPRLSRTQLFCFQGLSTRRRDATNN